MPKFLVERITTTSHKQTVDAKDAVSAIARAKRKSKSWDLDSQTEEWNATTGGDPNPIGFGR